MRKCVSVISRFADISVGRWLAGGVLAVVGMLSATAQAATCARTLTADVVALDQAFFWNRLGAVQPQGMIFALRRDVVDAATDAPIGTGGTPGQVELRATKRVRPLVLRMNVGDCLTIKFTNLLAPSPKDEQQPATRHASVHVQGLQLVGGIGSDGSHVGANPSGGVVAPGGSATYTYYADYEGTYNLYSTGANTGGEGNGGSLNAGLFGAVNVEPRGSEWYRSQVTAADLALASSGSTPSGQPMINYSATYPNGLPILKMLKDNEIVHSDLTAIIAGPNAGPLPAGTYRDNPVYPNRNQPFREFTVIYHDEIGAVQAFPIFEDPVMEHTLHGVRDAFAINYGTAGAGAEILANRYRIGPMHNCAECKYEEFFLSSWVVGDPAMIVDVPANANTDPVTGVTPAGPKATKAFYPDDPSNVYHSYLRDHVKFRVLHAGTKEHHIHHQHAKQWLHSPDSDLSTYNDSQAIGPGSAFTFEMTHHGSGNRNQTVGDALFHCHLYPHFAQGMWAIWRAHDVFEKGTTLDANGRPASGSRALPDGEIAAGTPIPGVVPLPTLAMAPMPGAAVEIANGQAKVTGTGNPGFPFFVPGVAGHRPPSPPLDIVDDGGLPRHVITGGTATQTQTRLDFSKHLVSATAEARPAAGTPTEIAAMAFHSTRNHGSYTPDGAPATFVTNGLPSKPGAPFADPCIDDGGNAVGTKRLYKGADIQIDLKINKAGWHNPQSRILTLWEDVQNTISGSRPPEPLFMRANTNDCIEFLHTNLLPGYYEQDAFQVKTPTDIMGQHIHLVKFDVLASDGAANGWNYTDGTMGPDDVRETIAAINAGGGLTPFGGGTKTSLAAKTHPFFGAGPNGSWVGAQTTVQRWFADNVLNAAGRDRTLRTVYTHDHFTPSTQQHTGLYAGLVIEPPGSIWRHPETGVQFGTRSDGGPTSWQANIITANQADSYREFLLEIQDFHLAYRQNGTPVNPPARKEIGLPFLVEAANPCPGGVPAPCPEAISAEDPGTMSVNYRNEPIALRVRDPNTNTQAAGAPGDLSNVFRSDITRADPALNAQPTFYPPLTGGVMPGDPFTPLLRAYEGDKVQVRVMVGAHEEMHNFAMHGVKWLFEPSDANSGHRNSQMMGISEHFEFVLPPIVHHPTNSNVDYLYTAGASTDDLWNGMWGIMRVYHATQSNLTKLPNNNFATEAAHLTNESSFENSICPLTAPRRNFSVAAVLARDVLPGGTLVYNSRTNQGGALNDPTSILFVRASDLDSTGKLKPSFVLEPLILRAAAGDCINVTLTNRLPAGALPDLPGFNTLPMIVDRFNANQIAPSSIVGLHPQLVHFDMTRDGFKVGMNPTWTTSTAPGGPVAPGASTTYQWYAGEIRKNADGSGTAVPIEYGAINLTSSDPIKHSNKGAVGALIIEPQGSTWVEDIYRSSATIKRADGTRFREFVTIFQNDINLRFGDGSAVPNTAESEDSEDSGQKAINYRTEPMWKRLGFAPDTPLEQTRLQNFANALSNSLQVGGQPIGEPVTPVFTATAGSEVRFRVLQPAGHQRNNVFLVHGHGWLETPWIEGSTKLGFNPTSNYKPSFEGQGPSSQFNAVMHDGAGGEFGVTGDYLYRTFQSAMFDNGQWGLMRVKPPVVDTAAPVCTITKLWTGSPPELEVRLTDAASGITAVEVTQDTNARLTIPPFITGKTDTVVVSGRRVVETSGARVMLRGTDHNGNQVSCDPVSFEIARDDKQSVRVTYDDIPEADKFVVIVNGGWDGVELGMKSFELTVNGVSFGKDKAIRDAESVVVDISSALKAGDKNVVTVEAKGQKDAAILVHITDDPGISRPAVQARTKSTK